MDLLVDLEIDAVRADGVLDLHSLAGALRRPRHLLRLLRDHAYQGVEVRTDELPMSGLQALVQLSLIASRADVWMVRGRRLSRSGFAAHALGEAAIALPRELARSAVATRRLSRAARREYAIPPDSGTDARSALYIRAEPSLRWQRTQVGGAATHTQGVINGLLANGVNVHVLAAEQPAGTERAAFTAVPPRRVLQLIRGLAFTDYAAEIVRAASGLRADFVYLRYQYGSYAGLELAERLAVPLVLEFNGPEIWVERHWRSGRMALEQPLEALERRHLLEATLVVVVSAALRDHVVAQGVAPERVLVNPNGVDLEQLAPYRSGTPAEWRSRMGVPEAPTVGFIGTFGPWHGVHLLPALIAAVPEARWVLIGGGGVFDEVRAELAARGLADRVLLTGVVERDQALRLLAGTDVCVSPHVPNPDGTPFFGSPTKLFEYMGLRKAIVASDLDQIGEVIEHERSGLLVSPGDVEATAASVRRLLEDPPLRGRLAAAALERVTRQYSWNEHARRILSALHNAGNRSEGCVGSVGSR